MTTLTSCCAGQSANQNAGWPLSALCHWLIGARRRDLRWSPGYCVNFGVRKKEILWHQKLKVSYWMWHMHMQTCTVHSQVLRSITHKLNIFFWSTYYKCGFKGIYSFKIISQSRVLTLWHCEHYGDVCDHTGRAESRADAASGPQQRAADARGHLEQPDARARHQLPAWPGSGPHGQARDLLRTRWKWCKWFIYITNRIYFFKYQIATWLKISKCLFKAHV